MLALLLVGVFLAPLALGHRQAGSLEMAYGNAAVNVLSRTRGSSVGQNPVAGSSQAIQAGRQAYVGSCGQCHGSNGDGKGIFGQSTFPPATDFTSKAARDLTDQQMFDIVKHGLGYTAMPAYASQYSDEDIWSLVTFIRELQKGQTKGLATVDASAEQLTFADFQSADESQRGAAVYFAQGCAVCHGPTGEAPEQINVDVKNPETVKTIREGTKGMPRYGTDLVSDQQLRDLLAYMATFPVRDEEE